MIVTAIIVLVVFYTILVLNFGWKTGSIAMAAILVGLFLSLGGLFLWM